MDWAKSARFIYWIYCISPINDTSSWREILDLGRCVHSLTELEDYHHGLSSLMQLTNLYMNCIVLKYPSKIVYALFSNIS